MQKQIICSQEKIYYYGHSQGGILNMIERQSTLMNVHVHMNVLGHS